MDIYGRIGRNWAENLELKDNYGRLWTIGSTLHNRMVSVASHIPPASSAQQVCVRSL